MFRKLLSIAILYAVILFFIFGWAMVEILNLIHQK